LAVTGEGETGAARGAGTLSLNYAWFCHGLKLLRFLIETIYFDLFNLTFWFHAFDCRQCMQAMPTM
jgi:hypothetical protein